MRYDRFVHDALLGVVRESFRVLEKMTAFSGDHHFYITLRTKTPGVVIPEYILSRYPDEITLVLQHQFYNLKVTDEAFHVTLLFNEKPEHLVIPFAAISIFADPSVNFALQFQPLSEGPDLRPQPPEPSKPESNVVSIKSRRVH